MCAESDSICHLIIKYHAAVRPVIMSVIAIVVVIGNYNLQYCKLSLLIKLISISLIWHASIIFGG